MSNVCKRYKVIGQEKPVQLLPKLAVSIPRGVPWYSGRGPPEGQGSGPGWTCPISLASVGKKPSPFGLKSHLSFSAESKAQSWSGSGSSWCVFCYSVIKSCLTLCNPWTAACQASLSFTICWSLLKLKSIELVMPSNHLILCYPFLLLPSIFPSIRVFSNELVLCIRWPGGEEPLH